MPFSSLIFKIDMSILETISALGGFKKALLQNRREMIRGQISVK